MTFQLKNVKLVVTVVTSIRENIADLLLVQSSLIIEIYHVLKNTQKNGNQFSTYEEK